MVLRCLPEGELLQIDGSSGALAKLQGDTSRTQLQPSQG